MEQFRVQREMRTLSSAARCDSLRSSFDSSPALIKRGVLLRGVVMAKQSRSRGANYTGTGETLASVTSPFVSPSLEYSLDFDDPPDAEQLALFKQIVIALRFHISERLLISYSSFYEACCVCPGISYSYSNNFLKTHR